VVATLNTVSAQYQCVKNGFLIGQIQKATNGQAIVFVSGQGLVATSDAHTIVDVFIPVRAGEIISTRAYGIYALNVYEE